MTRLQVNAFAPALADIALVSREQEHVQTAAAHNAAVSGRCSSTKDMMWSMSHLVAVILLRYVTLRSTQASFGSSTQDKRSFAQTAARRGSQSQSIQDDLKILALEGQGMAWSYQWKPHRSACAVKQEHASRHGCRAAPSSRPRAHVCVDGARARTCLRCTPAMVTPECDAELSEFPQAAASAADAIARCSACLSQLHAPVMGHTAHALEACTALRSLTLRAAQAFGQDSNNRAVRTALA